MKILIVTLAATVGSGVLGCGKKDCSPSGAGVVSNSCSSDTSKIQSAGSSSFTLKGSITTAFDVTVNGKDFPDGLESYYTEEVGKLSDDVTAAGYAGYKATFDAQIGFNDLAIGQTVYVAPTTQRGYSGQTVVAGDSTFALTLPAEAANDVYQIRSNKRIAINLVNAKDKTDTKKFCYNFSAINLNVPFGDKDRPIVLNNFKSTITAYACKTDPGVGSLAIPPNSSNPTVVSGASSGTSATNDGKLSDHDKSIITAMQALTEPAQTDDLIYVGHAYTPLVRTPDKSKISEVSAANQSSALLTWGGSAANLAFHMFSGLPYVVVGRANGHSLKVGDFVYLSGPLAGLGLDIVDFKRVFVVEVIPDQDSFVIRASKAATSTGDIIPTSVQDENAYHLTSAMESNIWSTAAGVDSTVRSTAGYAFAIKADGSICWDSSSATATLAWILAGGSTIVCK